MTEPTPPPQTLQEFLLERKQLDYFQRTLIKKAWAEATARTLWEIEQKQGRPDE